MLFILFILVFLLLIVIFLFISEGDEIKELIIIAIWFAVFLSIPLISSHLVSNPNLVESQKKIPISSFSEGSTEGENAKVIEDGGGYVLVKYEERQLNGIGKTIFYPFADRVELSIKDAMNDKDLEPIAYEFHISKDSEQFN